MTVIERIDPKRRNLHQDTDNNLRKYVFFNDNITSFVVLEYANQLGFDLIVISW